MGAVYAGGTIVNALAAAGTVATKNNLSDFIKTQLLAAGWTLISGSTGSWVLQSALTDVGVTGLSCRVNMDNAATNCLRLFMSRGTGTDLATAALFLLPNNDYRIIANKFQFFCFSPGASPTRTFACGGQLYVPTQYGSPASAVWGSSNAINDTDVTTRNSFRTKLVAANTNNINSGDTPNEYSNYNGNPWNVDNQVAINATPGGQRFSAVTGALANPTATPSTQVINDFFFIYDSLPMWGLTGVSAQAKIVGQIWDSYISSQTLAGDTNEIFDAHTFWAITNNNSGAANDIAGTLLVACA